MHDLAQQLIVTDQIRNQFADSMATNASLGSDHEVLKGYHHFSPDIFIDLFYSTAGVLVFWALNKACQAATGFDVAGWVFATHGIG